MKVTIKRSVEVIQTPRLQQMLGLFDVAPAKVSEQMWDVDLALPEQWNVGVIVGPSGAGKSTVASELFGANMVAGWEWPHDKCLLDGFPASMSIKDVTGLLSSVGFSSPPYWMRPFRVLSNGQQFRANLARTLAEQPDLAVVDEFTSVVDRTVAQIGSAAVAKTVRRRGQKFVAVTCHYDVLDWLEPDWIYEPHTGKLEVADAARGSVRRRPEIELEIVRVHSSAWELFKGHHYLSADLHRSAKCFVGLVKGQPAAFTAVLPFPHPTKPAWREHRTVCLPDFQGVGIGNTMSEYVASVFSAHKPYCSCTSHPSMIRHRSRSKVWRTSRRPSFNNSMKGLQQFRKTQATNRLTSGFEYVGPRRPEDAEGFAVLPAGAVLRKSPGCPSPRMVQSA
ncbi:MAG: ABC transporter ATP-binding protein [Phycisphaerae bacterium]|nr:ABC transporter ATP-binding protein [Phycisphaerae bacterium]